MKKIGLVIALICAIAVGTTFAYLNATTNTVTNTFTSGRNIAIELKESKWDGYQFGETIPGTPGSAVKPGRETDLTLGINQARQYLPADVINKNPSIKNNTDNGSVYIAFKLVFEDHQANKMSRDAFEKAYGKLDISEQFSKIENDESSLFISNETLDTNEVATLFSKVTLNTDIALVEGKLPNFSIQATGYAVQGNIDAETAKTELINLAK